MKKLTFTSCMAANADFIGKKIADCAAEILQIETEFVDNIPWQEREKRFDQGTIQVCWICGLPYIWKADDPLHNIELLVAPVLQGKRYLNQPVYHSDLIVHQDSRFESFSDLEGASWAYNEPKSLSGCYVMRYHLSTLGLDESYFGKVIESGAHQVSLQMILNREIDVAAVDTSVLDQELKKYPEMESKLRAIGTLGPNPIPPWVVSKDVPQEMREKLRTFFLEFHQSPKGLSILNEWNISHFSSVQDQDYDRIRQMAAPFETSFE